MLINGCIPDLTMGSRTSSGPSIIAPQAEMAAPGVAVPAIQSQVITTTSNAAFVRRGSTHEEGRSSTGETDTHRPPESRYLSIF
jgi:hypothetical protein